MKRFVFIVLAFLFLWGCGFPKETRRGVGNEGFLVIQVIPDDAEIFVDGQLVGEAGKFEKDPLELSSGTHKIEIHKSGFISEVREVYAGNQSRQTLKVNLRKSP